MINNIFFELLQVSIGTREGLSKMPTSKEWGKLYKMAEKQSLVGICFAGVQKISTSPLNGENSGEEWYGGMPEMLYLTWMGLAAQIQRRNEVMNQRCLELQSRVVDEGFMSCILKGQGVAQSYGAELCNLRQSGDIDIWMDGGFEKVNAWVQKVAPTKVVNQHHVDLNLFDDTEIEAHYHPINMTNPWHQRVLKGFIKAYEDECLSCVHNGTIHTPSKEFNLVFLMVHIFHHLFTEGIGLRQMMDYYMVLRTGLEGQGDLKVQGGQDVQRTISDLGLDRFASALMWVMGHVFGLRKEQMPWKPCERDGRFLLDEIMQSGNFGKQDKRQRGLYKSKWNSFWMVHLKTFRFWRFDHWAWFWSPVERIRGYAWRRMHGYKQY